MQKIPSPWRRVLERELRKLGQREDVVAVGVAGSLAYGDTWPGSDIDIEVVLRGDSPKKVVNTEQDFSVDYGYFGEAHLAEIPYDTRPVFDPSGVLTRELCSRNHDETINSEIGEAVDQSRRILGRAEEALRSNPYSALVHLHLVAWRLAVSFTLAAGENKTVRRAVSRLEKAAVKIGREDFLEAFGALFSFSTSIALAGVLLNELQAGYREIWGYFRDKAEGPGYMQQQPDSESWFKNRIRPLYDYDRRDLVWVVLSEFPFVLYFCFRVAGHERTPMDVFQEAEKLKGPPLLWAQRYYRVLELFDSESIPSLLKTAGVLINEVEELTQARLWARNH